MKAAVIGDFQDPYEERSGMDFGVTLMVPRRKLPAMAEPRDPASADSGGDEGELHADRLSASLAKAREADASPRMYRIAKLLRDLLPGDRELGDPLSTAGDRPSHLLA